MATQPERCAVVQLTASTCKHLTDLAAKRDNEVFVYFTATWCGDCTRSTPLVDKAFARRGNCTLFKVDVGDKAAFREIRETHLKKYNVSCLPTVLYLGKAGARGSGGPRLDEKLEQCSDAAAGLQLVNEFADNCLKRECPFPFIMLHDPKKGLVQHPVKLAMCVALVAWGVTSVARAIRR